MKTSHNYLLSTYKRGYNKVALKDAIERSKIRQLPTNAIKVNPVTSHENESKLLIQHNTFISLD